MTVPRRRWAGGASMTGGLPWCAPDHPVIGTGIRRGATLAQLTSDRSRTSAHRFYERLGFVPSHVGFTLPLQPQA
jgi:hypothetical protein